jgi:hypothetical protein
MNSKKSILTEPFSNLIAAQVKKLTTSSSNTFIGIGRIIDSGSTENNIENAIYTTVYRNQVYKNLVALKKIVPSDIQPVIPRVDWTSNRMYDAYDDMIEIYDYRDYYSFGTVNANANTVLTGTVNIAASNVVVGNGTSFLTYVFSGDQISVNNSIKTVLYTVNNSYLIVNTAFANTNTGSSITLIQNNTIIVANSANFIGNVGVGNVIVIGEDTREVVALRNNKVIAVNTSLTYSNSNVTIRRQDNTFTLFANTFYVRNTRDQVFKCLFNNAQAN